MDGAELILRLLQEVGETATRDGGIPHLAEALQAVLDKESDLNRIKDLRKDLQAQVSALV